jgi:TrmH family RNA methyltransferase
MEQITSRKNKIISEIKLLASDPAARRALKLYVCDGEKQLSDAIQAGAEVAAVLSVSGPRESLPSSVRQYRVPEELLRFVSPLKNSPGPVFTVKIPGTVLPEKLSSAIVLESIQDPGNVGTIIRTANALGIDAVILTGCCTDPYNPKAARAAMGALFRQRVTETSLEELIPFLGRAGLKLYGAALSDRSSDLRRVSFDNCAAAVGTEGKGLSERLLRLCAGEIIIPMRPGSESLNAAAAAAVIMWEMVRGRI